MTSKEISNSFLRTYYDTFDTNIKSLYTYYTVNASMTYLNEEIGGQLAIQNKFNNLHFVWCKHNIIFCNCQLVDLNKLIIVALGTIQEYDKQTNYHEVFVLINENNRWFINNHIFNII